MTLQYEIPQDVDAVVEAVKQTLKAGLIQGPEESELPPSELELQLAAPLPVYELRDPLAFAHGGSMASFERTGWQFFLGLGDRAWGTVRIPTHARHSGSVERGGYVPGTVRSCEIAAEFAAAPGAVWVPWLLDVPYAFVRAVWIRGGNAPRVIPIRRSVDLLPSEALLAEEQYVAGLRTAIERRSRGRPRGER